jgi:hypothetical protein
MKESRYMHWSQTEGNGSPWCANSSGMKMKDLSESDARVKQSNCDGAGLEGLNLLKLKYELHEFVLDIALSKLDKR